MLMCSQRRMCADTCADMCADMCADTCADMCADVCADMCAHAYTHRQPFSAMCMRRDVCRGVRVDTCADMRADICTDMCTGRCIDSVKRCMRMSIHMVRALCPYECAEVEKRRAGGSDTDSCRGSRSSGNGSCFGRGEGWKRSSRHACSRSSSNHSQCSSSSGRHGSYEAQADIAAANEIQRRARIEWQELQRDAEVDEGAHHGICTFSEIHGSGSAEDSSSYDSDADIAAADPQIANERKRITERDGADLLKEYEALDWTATASSSKDGWHKGGNATSFHTGGARHMLGDGVDGGRVDGGHGHKGGSDKGEHTSSGDAALLGGKANKKTKRRGQIRRDAIWNEQQQYQQQQRWILQLQEEVEGSYSCIEQLK